MWHNVHPGSPTNAKTDSASRTKNTAHPSHSVYKKFRIAGISRYNMALAFLFHVVMVLVELQAINAYHSTLAVSTQP